MTNEFVIEPKQKQQTGKNEHNGGYDSAEHDGPR